MESIKRLLVIPLMAILVLLCISDVEASGKPSETEGEIFYVKNKNVPRTAWIDCTEDDMYWFYKCIEAEEGGNDYRAKYLAACCIVNRWRQGWQGSIEEVIFYPKQFEVVRNKRIYDAMPSEESIAACNAALDEPETWVIAFSMGNLHRAWATPVETVDGEYFYKEKR